MNKPFFILLLMVLSSCKPFQILKLMSSADVEQINFDRTIDFDYVNKHLFIDIEINGKLYKFLFDTGWEITGLDERLIDEFDFKPSTKIKATGSAIETYKMQFGTIPNLKIDNVLFEKVGVGIHNMDHINERYTQYGKIDGVIGTNILKNANWQIDYVNQKIRFTNDFSNLKIAANSDTIQLSPRVKSKWGLKKIKVNLDGYIVPFIFDTGSSGAFTMNNSHIDSVNEAKIDQGRLKGLTKEEIENYLEMESAFGKDDVSSTLIAEIKLDKFLLKNQTLRFEPKVSSLVGNDFLENYLVTILWEANKLILSDPSK